MSLDIALAILFTIMFLIGLPFAAWLGAEFGDLIWQEFKAALSRAWFGS